MKKKDKAYKRMSGYKAIEMPYVVWRLLPDNNNRVLDVYGDQACIGGDYASLSEFREALDWLVDQLGGKVEWKDEN